MVNSHGTLFATVESQPLTLLTLILKGRMKKISSTKVFSEMMYGRAQPPLLSVSCEIAILIITSLVCAILLCFARFKFFLAVFSNR